MQLRERARQGTVARHREQVARRHGDGGVHGGEVPAERDARRQQRERQPQDARRRHGLRVRRRRRGQRRKALRGHDAHEEPLEQRVHREDDERRENKRPRDGEVRVAYLLSHGAAGLEPGEAPPDHGDCRYEPARPHARQEVGRLDEVRQRHVGDHGEKPDEGASPEEEHEPVLQTARDLHAAHVRDRERDERGAGKRDVVHGQFHAESQKHRLEVVAERERLAARHRHERDDEAPSRQKAERTAQAQRRVPIRAARIGQSRAHLRVEQGGVDADEHRDERGEDDARAHLAHDGAARGEQPHADDRARRDGDGFAQSERALERKAPLRPLLWRHGAPFVRARPARCRSFRRPPSDVGDTLAQYSAKAIEERGIGEDLAKKGAAFWKAGVKNHPGRVGQQPCRARSVSIRFGDRGKREDPTGPGLIAMGEI